MRDSWYLGTLGALLLASEALYLVLVRLNAVNGVRPVLAFLGLMGVLFALYAAAGLIVEKLKGIRAALLLVASGAILFRLTLIPAGLPTYAASPAMTLADLCADLRGESVTYERFLLFDDDIWRYLWDGHVAAHGINPYSYPPESPALDRLADPEEIRVSDGRGVWSDIRDNISYAATRTIYPPLAQEVFRLSHALAPGSVAAMKAVVVLFDLLAAFFLALTLKAMGRSPALVVLYAWNPLVIKAFAGSGHIDSVLVAALAATMYFLVRRARVLAAASLGLSILAKLSPLALLPFMVKRVGLRNCALTCGIILAGYLPFLSAGRGLFEGIRVFARTWRFNAGPWDLFRWVLAAFTAHPDFLARVGYGLVVLILVVWLAWRDDGQSGTFARPAVMALGAVILLSPAVMPWYVTWLLPLAVVANLRAWLCFSCLVCLAFLVMIDGTEHGRVLWLEYGIFGVLLLHEMHRRIPNQTAAIPEAVPEAGIPTAGNLLRHEGVKG